MSKSKPEAVPETAATPEAKAPEISDATQRVALELFSRYALQYGRNYSHEMLAVRAFREALAFQATLDKIKDGVLSVEPAAPPKREMVTIEHWRAHKSTQNFERVRKVDANGELGEVETFQILSDPEGYCPNLPIGHPANARFRPAHGPSLEERIKQFRRDIQQPAHIEGRLGEPAGVV